MGKAYRNLPPNRVFIETNICKVINMVEFNYCPKCYITLSRAASARASHAALSSRTLAASNASFKLSHSNESAKRVSASFTK